MLIWPDGPCYEEYRLQMMCFNIYLAFIQYLQFAYQRGVLYRLRSLGERSTDMDITIDGFHSWMFKGVESTNTRLTCKISRVCIWGWTYYAQLTPDPGGKSPQDYRPYCLGKTACSLDCVSQWFQVGNFVARFGKNWLYLTPYFKL